jgi:serine protease Do
VTAKSPAEKAGLKTGDVVVEYNGKKIRDSRHLKLEVARSKPGERVPVKVVRDGKNKELEVAVKQLPGTEVAGKSGAAGNEDGTLDGVTVADLDSQARRQMNIPGSVQGVVVTEVDPGSPSAEAGLRAGDVILEIDRKPVSSAEEAVELSAKVTKEKTLLRVWRDGGTRFVVVDESKAG